MKGSDRDDTPVLITGAAVSYEDQHRARKRKYAIIMGARIPCLVLAGFFLTVVNIWWLALLFVVLSVPLPWVAVLIANDRPPRRSEEINRFDADRAARRALRNKGAEHRERPDRQVPDHQAPDHQVIDGG